MALFELRGITKAFGAHQVLRGVDLDVHKGEFLTIIGESGCGKSLVLKSLIGIMTPDAGSLTFDGEEVAKYTDTQWTRLRPRIGMLFQESALFDSLDVGDNVAYGLREAGGMSEDDIRARVAECLRLVGLEGVERKWPADLSGGMKKRVALARATALRPEIILYDEPTEGLDPINVTRVNRMLQSLREEFDITTVVVTHNMQSAFNVSTRVAFIHDGRVKLEGTPDALRNSQDPDLEDFLLASRDPVADHRVSLGLPPR
ncbi:MAG: ATP-binding cassette domain-containing protein [Sandaracinaceae bacterium]|nr:ATP-binding cassette domain-containing protein [Sandaracinaceae bacterium]MBK6809515.1 ATP-binding cassette domain-containing protein [Sandaracinaceae bacterium]MBK7155305.1 ATP-binding cassette domain-containing protein [Sandaracinaceae bacterium]MBK7778588.1 ATP-binding cassette domain-containing protein [Sandaracinaceae bacterium]MBK8412358.1 ATP-binding cassette domain-containing protein [Sandaracinaceae bacterium]